MTQALAIIAVVKHIAVICTAIKALSLLIDTYRPNTMLYAKSIFKGLAKIAFNSAMLNAQVTLLPVRISRTQRK